MMPQATSSPVSRRIRGHTASLSCLKDEELVLMAQGGSNSAYEQLMLVYGPIVKRVASRYFLLGAEKEDVIQEGFVGLCSAIRSYRSANKTRRFQAFAVVCLTRQIQTAVRAASRVKHTALNEAGLLSGCDNSPELVQDSSPIHLNSPDLIEELVSEFCSSLTTFESSVLQGIASGHSYSDISKLLCCPLKAVDNGIQRAKRKILTNRDC
jgi:RNA polymerase sporulation-specific sigma factor